MAIGKANEVLAVQIVFNMHYSFESLALSVPSVATEATVYTEPTDAWKVLMPKIQRMSIGLLWKSLKSLEVLKL
jgi:hypothetical protein